MVQIYRLLWRTKKSNAPFWDWDTIWNASYFSRYSDSYLMESHRIAIKQGRPLTKQYLDFHTNTICKLELPKGLMSDINTARSDCVTMIFDQTNPEYGKQNWLQAKIRPAAIGRRSIKHP